MCRGLRANTRYSSSGCGGNMLIKWLHQYIPGRPEVLADQSTLLETNPDLFWLWVAGSCVALLLALAQKDYVAFWCFGVLATTLTAMFATRRATWDTPLGDLLLIATGIAAVVFMANLSNKQRKLTGSGGVGCMWVFAALAAGLAALWLLSRGGG